MPPQKKLYITRKIKRGSLIQYALDGINRESFEVIKTELAALLKKRAGVYALYQNDKLVRVGLGTNILATQGPCENQKAGLEYSKPFYYRCRQFEVSARS